MTGKSLIITIGIVLHVLLLQRNRKEVTIGHLQNLIKAALITSQVKDLPAVKAGVQRSLIIGAHDLQVLTIVDLLQVPNLIIRDLHPPLDLQVLTRARAAVVAQEVVVVAAPGAVVARKAAVARAAARAAAAGEEINNI